MDFSYLLEIAKQNEEHAKEAVQVKRYSTQISASKKHEKSGIKSDAIQSFLRKKELEERQREKDAKKKKEELLALRSQDRKANARVQAMLKRTKSASKAVLDVRPERTTSANGAPAAEEEEDCDYVSEESSQFFKSFVEKYGSDISTGKNLRMFKQIHKDAEPRKKSASNRDEEDAEPERKKSGKEKGKSRKEESRKESSGNAKVKETLVAKSSRPKPPPPEATLSFHEILKLAAQKQSTPSAGDKKPVAAKEAIREAEFERPMTQKEKEEYLREKEHQLRREGKLPPLPKQPEKTASSTPVSKPSKTAADPKKQTTKPEKKAPDTKPPPIPAKPEPSKSSRPAVPPAKTASSKTAVPTPTLKPSAVTSTSKIPADKLPARPAQMGPKPAPAKFSADPRNLPSKGKALAAPRQFPPYRDIRPPAKRPLESDEEYDSELDDFIDDGPEEGAEDYSRYIKEIFGYDRSRYRRIVSDDEEECMESSFTQQMKEEKISTKIGIMEDLEDIRREEEEKKRKATKKKKKI